MVAGLWYFLALSQGGREFLFMVIKENFGSVIGADAGHPSQLQGPFLVAPPEMPARSRVPRPLHLYPPDRKDSKM